MIILHTHHQPGGLLSELVHLPEMDNEGNKTDSGNGRMLMAKAA